MKLFLCTIFFSVLLWQNSYGTCTLPAPTGVKATNIASCQFKAQWDAVGAATGYNLQYKISTDVTWTLISLGNVTAKTITGLNSNTTYNFKVCALCSGGEEGTYSNSVTAVTVVCSKPTDVAITSITSSSATVTWSVPCGESLFNLKYRVKGTSSWTTKKNIAATSYALTGLQSNTAYETKIASVCVSNSKYTSIKNFTTLTAGPAKSGKNVLLVIIDDARWDTYTANNGPSFFADTNISRIANEGVNFKVAFPTLSMCAPCRGSITTGCYPHITGVTNNPEDGGADTIYLKTLPEILHDNGYYNGLIGKYHISKFPQPGYDYWMECHKTDYTDTKYNYNGHDKKIPGHQTDVVTDSALAFFDKVPAGKPFFLWLAYRAPHNPFDSGRAQDIGLFDNDIMPYPANNAEYTKNYPGFLYDCHKAGDSLGMINKWRGYFELLQGVEESLGKVYGKMDSLGIMDSTLIIFMSDNGYMLGEHDLEEKQMAYEESIKVPLFMRYPKIFPAGKLVKKELALNIDIAPTILDFAGIEDTFGMQGVSLIKMYNNEVSRTEMMYEFFNKDCVPDIRAVRSLDYKYVQYNCNVGTEEFFDLNADKNEDSNLINNPAYSSIIAEYKDKLVYWRSYYNDSTWDSLYTCSLTNPQRIIRQPGLPLIMLNVYPSPAHENFRVSFISEENAILSLQIINSTGQIVDQEILTDPVTEFSKNINTNGMSPGIYTVEVQHGNYHYQKQFVIQ